MVPFGQRLNRIFEDETGHGYTVENAVAYLKSLPKTAYTVALHYIDSAPEEVVTPLRTALSDIVRRAKYGEK